MSLDLSIGCPHCGQDMASFNYTYNCAPMWYLACPGDERMVVIEGMTGAESRAKLKMAHDNMVENPINYIALNPKNGWGSYDTFKEWIESLIRAADEYPAGVWRASR